MPPTDPDSPSEGIEVPYDSLAPDTLRAVVEEFVTREGTEYGRSDYSLDQKVDHVMRQLRRGEACVTFDPESGSVGIAAKPG